MLEFKRAFKLSMPSLFAYFPLGIVFGVLFTHLHYPWYLAPVMSAFVYAGSVQFVALSMMANHSTVLAILLATSFIAVRNSFYGLSLTERFKTHPLVKFFLIFGLVDSTYAVLMTNPAKEGENDILFVFFVTVLIYSYWLVGTFIGALLASRLPDFSGMSFILPCFFMVLVIEYYLLNKALSAIFFPIAATAVAYILMPKQFLIIAIIMSVVFIGFYHKRQEAKK